MLRIALRATALRAALGPGDRCGPWDQEKRAGPGLPRRCARRANPPVAGPQEHAERQDTAELAFDTRKEAENYKPRVVSRIKRGRSVKDQVRLDTGADLTGADLTGADLLEPIFEADFEPCSYGFRPMRLPPSLR